jgi:hypothetical protein
MTIEEKRQWWNELEATWKRFFKIHINPMFHSEREARERFVPDDEQLEGLFQTEYLAIYNSSINSFKCLAPMEKLNGLHCRDMPFLTSLEELPLVQQLHSFRLTSSKVTSFIPIGDMKNIVALELSGNPVKNLDGLEQLKTLKELTLSEKGISDLTPLKNLPALEQLTLTEMKIIDFSALQTVASLKWLIIERMTVPSFAFLKGLQNLEKLFCEGISIGVLEGLSTLTNLKTLNLNYCVAEDLSPVFSSLTGLTELSLIGTKITSLAALNANRNLLELSITEAHFSLEEIMEFKKLHPDCAIYPEQGKNFPFSKYETYEVLQELEVRDSMDNIKAGTKVKFTSYTFNGYDTVDMYYFSELDRKNNFLWTLHQYDDKRVSDYFRKI